MANIYAKVHRLKSLGWTWDQFLFEFEKRFPAGIDEKTLYALYRQPHRKPSRHISQEIEALHQEFFPSPFPADIEALMALYSNLMASKRHPTLDQDIEYLQSFLKGELAQQNDGQYRLRSNSSSQGWT